MTGSWPCGLDALIQVLFMFLLHSPSISSRSVRVYIWRLFDYCNIRIRTLLAYL